MGKMLKVAVRLIKNHISRSAIVGINLKKKRIYIYIIFPAKLALLNGEIHETPR